MKEKANSSVKIVGIIAAACLLYAVSAGLRSVYGKLFGSENLATLFGIVFLSHQCGSFFSAWLGGKCVEITGSYVLIDQWYYRVAVLYSNILYITNSMTDRKTSGRIIL